MTSFVVPCDKCGVNVKVRVDTVGKQVRCTNCREIFVVPPPQAIPVTPEVVPETPPPQAIPVAPQSLPITPVPRQQVCPSCQKPLPGDAKICVDCGFDLRTGKKLQTVIEKKKKTRRSTAAADPHPRASAGSSAAPVAPDTFGLVGQDDPPGTATRRLRSCTDCGNDFPEQLDDCPWCAAERKEQLLSEPLLHSFWNLTLKQSLIYIPLFLLTIFIVVSVSMYAAGGGLRESFLLYAGGFMGVVAGVMGGTAMVAGFWQWLSEAFPNLCVFLTRCGLKLMYIVVAYFFSLVSSAIFHHLSPRFVLITSCFAAVFALYVIVDSYYRVFWGQGDPYSLDD